MSYTEIYKFGKDGNAENLGEVRNAFRGAMAVWMEMEKRYLSPYPKPMWMDDADYKERGYSRTSASMGLPMGGKSPMQEIWDLGDIERVSKQEKIVMLSTLDNVIVMRENIEELREAFESFDGETSLKEQAEIIKEALTDEDVIAVAWNQTSVNADVWTYYDEDEEYSQYNILTGEKHWKLFDDFKEEKLT